MRMRRFAAVALGAVIVAACGSDRGRPPRPPPPPPGVPSDGVLSGAPADRIVDAGRRALGVDTGEEALITIVADASVVGPEGEFHTSIRSASDGRARMEQSPGGFVAGIGRGGGWLVDPETSAVGELGPMDLFVRGHELHMLVLAPGSRLSNARLTTGERLGDTFAVAMDMPSGDSLVLYYSSADTLPAGLRVTWIEPNVHVRWSDWVERGGLRFFTTAVFRQGEEFFRYTYEDVGPRAIPDSVFEPPASPGDGR
ncbi:MAG: hypothetical protein R3195_10880 [Gemmatimonadota bacterium]|nr:hypothetical protein [Gemmatimonadota bacterium]